MPPLEFFSNTEADPSGDGEGELYLGAVVVESDTNGDASFNAGLDDGELPTSHMSLTATASELCNNSGMPIDPNDPAFPICAFGGLVTSEFSGAIPIMFYGDDEDDTDLTTSQRYAELRGDQASEKAVSASFSFCSSS